MKNNLWWKISTVLSLVGIGLAIYILYYYYSPSEPGICNINARMNCLPITKGNLKDLFGIPVALYGLIGYIFIFIASITKNKKLFIGMATFGVLFCLRITALEVFVEKVLCPICLVCQTIMLILFFVSIYLYKQKAEA